MRDPAALEHAKAMRQEMTEPEKRLWYQLRAKRFEGIKFRRHKVVGNYIPDFSSNDPKLIIEVDGDSHGLSEDYDARRTASLEKAGYRVVRFSNADVMGEMEGVLVLLTEILREMRALPPLPTLSPKGERALR
ncbi:MAG: endonuclease domain-containing protein [Alteripontixanthobacter sp.]